ncbi:MAG: NAD(P)-dependent oxidoreductase [Patescibacteria group bacterium]
MQFSGKRILVTGGAGFIGTHLTKRLVREEADVHLFVRENTDVAGFKTLFPNVTLHTVDLDDHEAVQETLKTLSPQGIFHLAAVNQSYAVRPTLKQLFRGNAENSLNLMEATSHLPIEFFVNTTTFVEAGPKTDPIREDDSLEPMEYYGISRIPGTLYVHALGKYQAKPFVTVRVFTPYGPFIQKGKLVYEIITHALSGSAIRLSRADVTRDLIFIDDLVDLFVRAAANAGAYPGHTFNGGSGVATPLGKLVEVVLQYTGSTSPVSWTGDDVLYDRAHWRADISKSTSLLSWKPTHSLHEGIAKTVGWFRERAVSGASD